MKVTPLRIRALPGELTLESLSSTWMKLVNLCPQKYGIYLSYIKYSIYINTVLKRYYIYLYNVLIVHT